MLSGLFPVQTKKAPWRGGGKHSLKRPPRPARLLPEKEAEGATGSLDMSNAQRPSCRNRGREPDHPVLAGREEPASPWGRQGPRPQGAGEPLFRRGVLPRRVGCGARGSHRHGYGDEQEEKRVRRVGSASCPRRRTRCSVPGAARVVCTPLLVRVVSPGSGRDCKAPHEPGASERELTVLPLIPGTRGPMTAASFRYARIGLENIAGQWKTGYNARVRLSSFRASLRRRGVRSERKARQKTGSIRSACRGDLGAVVGLQGRL